MSEHDVPAGRDELRERLLAIIESRRMEPWTDTGRPCCVMCGSRWDGEHKAECWVPTLREAAALLAPQEAREPELLGYVVERQLTTGEWVRVWRGSTMWFDHDEAVLDRDAYALDGIPARIRPVYLGAPAPERGLASATSEEGAGDAE